MRWWFYNLFFTIGYLLMLPSFLLRMRRRGGYRNRFGDRLGHYPLDIRNAFRALNGNAVWIHAVSVGEVYVAGQMMRALRQECPGIRFVLSTTSSTGWTEAQRQVSSNDVLIYHPVDFLPCVKRALQAIRPRALILTESEIWPNLIRSCQQRQIPVYLINARISDRSAPRYAALRFWFKPVLRCFQTIFAQSQLDADRLIDAGADPDSIQITGSFKFDVANRNPETEAAVRGFLERHGFLTPGSTLLLGGSTWPGEDSILIAAYRRLAAKHPGLRLAIAPRHFEKADAVEANILAAKLPCLRKSRMNGETASPTNDGAEPPVLLADTTGELMGLYSCADIAFVGKSLCEHGGQNMIEPCLYGVPTLIGPNTENFRPVMSDLLASDAIIQVPDAETLERELDRLLGDPQARKGLGDRASAAVERRRGCAARCASQLAASLRRKPDRLSAPDNDGAFRGWWTFWAFAANIFLGAFCSTWLRVFDGLAGRTVINSLTGAALMAAAFILGVTIFEWLFGQLRRPSRFLPIPLTLAAVTALIALCRIDRLAYLWQRLLVDGTRTSFTVVALNFNTALALFTAPAFIAGCIAVMTENSCLSGTRLRRRGSATFFLLTGLLPLWLGWLAGGAHLLPLFGIDRLSRLFVAAFAVLAAASALTARARHGNLRARHWIVMALCAVSGAVMCRIAFTREVRHPSPCDGATCRLIYRDTGFAKGKPETELCTAHHTMDTFTDPDYGFVFTIDGRPMIFGNRYHTARTLSAYLPLVFRPDAKTAAFIGNDAGLYLPFFHRAGVEKLAVAKADHRCLALTMAADARATNTDPVPSKLPSPDQLAWSFDIVYLAPEPPWMRGTAKDYTAAAFQSAAEMLNTNGVVALHLDTRALSTHRFAAIAREFGSAFESSLYWCMGQYDWVFLGGLQKPSGEDEGNYRGGLTASAEAAFELFDRKAVTRDLARAGIQSLPEFFASFVCDGISLGRWLDRNSVETAWRSTLKLPQRILGDCDDLFQPSLVEECRQSSTYWLDRDGMDESVFLAVCKRTHEYMRTRSLSVLALAEMKKMEEQDPGPEKDGKKADGKNEGEIRTMRRTGQFDALSVAADVHRINPRDIFIVRFIGSLELEARRRLGLSDFQGAIQCYDNLLKIDDNMALAHYGKGYCERALQHYENAENSFVRAVNAQPNQPEYRLELAQIEALQGKHAAADVQYEEILRIEPDNPEALYRFAVNLSSRSRAKKDFPRAIKLAEKACEITRWKMPEYAFGLADLYMDAGRVTEGMGLRRKLKEEGLSRQ